MRDAGPPAASLSGVPGDKSPIAVRTSPLALGFAVAAGLSVGLGITLPSLRGSELPGVARQRPIGKLAEPSRSQDHRAVCPVQKDGHVGGAVHGRVIDGADGKPVMEAIVTFSADGSGRMAATDGLGTFVLLGSAPEKGLRLSIVKSGYDVKTLDVRRPAGAGSIDIGTVRLGRREGGPLPGPVQTSGGSGDRGQEDR
jgi:hypothetical protein